MAFRDLLLGALTYPDATPDRALRSGVALAKRVGGELTLVSVRVDIPAIHNQVANALLKYDQLAAQEEARSAAVAELAGSYAAVAAADAEVRVTAQALTARLYEEGEAICIAARTRDLCILPIGPAVLGDRSLAEAVLFGSGRPMVVYPEDVEITPSSSFGRVAVAWDGSVGATRAIGDAMPILQRAREVRILVVTGEKPQAIGGIAGDLVRNLNAHDIRAVVDERPAAGEPIGRVLRAYVAEQRLDLLVMGGFGHTRLREFVLGGATTAILKAPPCPVLMSH